MSEDSSFTSLNGFLKWSEQTLNFEKSPQKNIFWLETMEYFCKALNNPQETFKSFHVAGSKGKGSVSCFIANILEESGFKTGVYSSPHIVEFAERIKSVSNFFDERIYEKSFMELKNCVDSIPLKKLPKERPVTWFELVTLLSFLTLKNANVDWGVYEVGLGGRLDATNVLKPKCSVITPIELEHTEFLGDTLEKIAYEKGGIIKENTPVIISEQQNMSVNEVFMKIAEERNAKIIFAEDLYKVSNVSFNKNKLPNVNKDKKYINERSVSDKKVSECNKNYTIERSVNVENFNNRIKNITNERSFYTQFSLNSPLFTRQINCKLSLVGEVQVKNASIAAVAVKTVLPEISEDTVEKALSKAYLPGRFEILENVNFYEKIPALILDGAHTPRSIAFSMQTWNSFFSEYKNYAHLLFACASDKDVEDIAPFFKGIFKSVTITRPGNVKKSDVTRMKNAFSTAGLLYEVEEDWNVAMKKVFSRADKEEVPVLVTGSFYLVSEAKKFLKNSPSV